MRSTPDKTSPDKTARDTTARDTTDHDTTDHGKTALDPSDLDAQGAVCVSQHGGWRLGRLHLGPDALTFNPPGHGTIRVDLNRVTALDVEWRLFVLLSKRVIRLRYEPRDGTARTMWAITAQLGDWEQTLRQRVKLVAAEPAQANPAPRRPVPPNLGAELAGISPAAGLVLDYLAYRGSATTAELVGLIGGQNEEALLVQLRDDLCRFDAALGGSAIRYEGAGFDRRSGTARQQSWWIHDTLAEGWLAWRVPTDILVEADEVVVVTTLPAGARAVTPTATFDAEGRRLVVRAGAGYTRDIALPAAVGGDARCELSATGTLVIRIARARSGATPVGTTSLRGTPVGATSLGLTS